MREDKYHQAVAMGRANANALELTRRHCRHARIELVGGNSWVGSALGLPMGVMEVRCEHAPPPRWQGQQVLDLAIEFYNENCIDCPFRDGTGELPNLATEAADRAAAEAERQADEHRRADERARRHRDREERRRYAVAGKAMVVRDLAKQLDLLDRAEPRTDPMSPDEQRSARHVIETARAAPDLFSTVLVDSVLELAADTADATALTVLRELVRGGRCPARRALEAALAALRRHCSCEAGDLVAFLQSELFAADLPDVLDQLINLASGDSHDRWRPPGAPAGLTAAADVDPTLVIRRLTEQLASEDEWTRHVAADATNVIISGDATRVVALADVLAGSVRGPDVGYAGYPHPSGAALNALATAWRGQPAMTRSIVESHGAAAPAEVSAELARIPCLLQRFHEPWDATDEATTHAVDFLVRRAGGDWGDEAADHAADTLGQIADTVPAVASRVDGLIGHVLALCTPEPEPVVDTVANPVSRRVEAMERDSRRIRRGTRRRGLAKTVGRSAIFDPARVLGSVLPLFTASTADQTYDRTVRTTLIDALEEAASPETLRDLVPIVYSALLAGDQVVRAAGIDLWVACARVAETLPEDLSDLAPVLLADSYVVVHRRMLEHLPRLGLPARLAPTLLRITGGWIITYKDSEPDVVEKAIRTTRALAAELEDTPHATRWYGFALAHVDRCRPHDRERLLTAWWPDKLRASSAWVTAALATAAAADLIDYYNRRSEPVLAALMNRPGLLAAVPLTQIDPLSEVHGAHHTWRAMEPVELLQAAGRWADAAEVARRVEERQPSGNEGGPGRLFAKCLVRSAEMSHLLVENTPDAATVKTSTEAVRQAVLDLEASRTDVSDDGPLRQALASLLSQTSAAEILHTEIVTEPAAAAEELGRAADLLAGTADPAHASARQRRWLSDAWRIACLLLRYDAGVRAADRAASALLEGAKRQAEILCLTMEAQRETPVTPGLLDFLRAVATISGVSEAEAAWRVLASAAAPACLVGTSLLPQRGAFGHASDGERRDAPLAVCVPSVSEVPVTDVLVMRPKELYTLGMMVRLVDVPEWAETCIVEPVTRLGRDALTLPRYVFPLADGDANDKGVTLVGADQIRCAIEQPVRDPPIDCPLLVRLIGDGHDEVVEVAGCRRLRLRPVDHSRDFVTEHEQTDGRLLTMFGRLDSSEFTTEDARAFCRLFAACVRSAQRIMFTKTFMRGAYVNETMFHNEMERLLKDDPDLEGRLTRRDAVAGGFDDLLHDDVIAELKVSKGPTVTVAGSAAYLGQPTQYGVGRGSQLSVLVILDHGRKTSPPGVIENYIGWLRPKLHGLEDPRYPSLVGVLIINTNLPVPSAWSRRCIEVDVDTPRGDPQKEK